MDNKYLIKKFLRQSLSPEEAKLFASKKEDIQFLEELENEIILVKNRHLLKEKLQKISKNEVLPLVHKKRAKNKIAYFIAAASIVLLITFSLFKSNSTNQEFYNSYYETYPNIYNQKGVKKTTHSSFEKAMQLYDSKNYKSAKSKFKDIQKIRPLNETELFYYGITLMELNNNELSKEQFRLIKDINSPFYIESQWYLALNLIKEDKIKDAKTLLKTILESNSVGQKRKNEVTQLLEDI